MELSTDSLIMIAAGALLALFVIKRDRRGFTGTSSTEILKKALQRQKDVVEIQNKTTQTKKAIEAYERMRNELLKTINRSNTSNKFDGKGSEQDPPNPGA